MSQTTVTLLLERLAHLPPSADPERALRGALQDFRRERESGGPMTEEEWRGLMLCARDLVHPPSGRSPYVGAGAIERALDGEIVGRA
ncbi:hypothetical protein [Chelatococcus reniformis]|uniref:Uncharacterized protein n=1 Tax=Chelatococcus reniformis TaxID=1494448 RepID=A0A916XLB2_9HYPH|nr:hypothetical protein [Chelatococcus reniformis]GGC83738.1 hypothetical protein GCM10010994_47040 [Chelatococcus reniformis]